MSAVPQIQPEPRSSAAASQDRRIQMLRTAMGPLIAAALEDPDVVEIMLNPDRTLWVDRLSSGRSPLGVEMPEADGERIIRLVAAHVGAEVHRGQPLLTAELPETGERFEGILPPAAPGPAFALRQDHAGERAAGRDRRHRRPRAGARRHHRAAMRGPRPCAAAHPRRRRHHDRAGAGHDAPAA